MTIQLSDKIKNLEQLGIEHVYEADFNKIRNISAEDFFTEILVNTLKAKKLFFLTLHERSSTKDIKKRAWFVYPIFKLIFRKADGIYAISDSLADFSVSMGFKKKPLIIIGTDLFKNARVETVTLLILPCKKTKAEEPNSTNK